jgi:hypothetical protein
MQSAKFRLQLKLPILFLFFFLIINKSFAQNEAVDGINLQLRQMFSPLLKPAPAKKFLYEMAAHGTDSIWYVANCADTNQTDVWYKVYDECTIPHTILVA